MEGELRLGRASLGHRQAGTAPGRVRYFGSRSAHADAGDRRGDRDEFPLASRARLRHPGHGCRAARDRRAKAKLDGRDLDCRFATLDFLAGSPPEGTFDFVFDRGCFHVFDEAEERVPLVKSHRLDRRRAARVGPPQRSACEVAIAIEPALEIVELRAAEFRDHGAKAWFCLSRRRLESSG